MRRGALAAAAYLLAGCPGGWQLQVRDGAEPTITNLTWQRIKCVGETFGALPDDSPWRAHARPRIHCSDVAAGSATFCNTSPVKRKQPSVTGKVRSLFSFVHLSDAQLKDHAVRMTGLLGDEFAYDNVASGSARNEHLERHDDAALLATVLAINSMADEVPGGPYGGWPLPEKPTFVLHTGDAVDAGMFSELFQFLVVMDQLKLPYYNVVGNHDNLFFGTMPADRITGLNVVAPYVPILSTERFMRYHSVSSEKDPTLPHPQIGREDHIASRDLTLYHGFDLACPRSREGVRLSDNQLCAEARGYYAFDQPLPDSGTISGRSVRMVVLNTSEILPQTLGEAFCQQSEAHMFPAQFAWLEEQLAATEPTFFLVFGHHNLDSFWKEEQGLRLGETLKNERRVLAYVTGHTHVDQAREHPRGDGLPLLEIIGGSTLVYPQLGRIVDLLEDDAGSIFVRALTFRQQLGEGYETGAPCELAHSTCDDEFPLDASPCRWVAQRAAYARAGAWADDDGDRRDEQVAVEAVNGVTRVFESEVSNDRR